MTDAVGLDFGQSECRLAYCANGQAVALIAATHLSQVWLHDRVQVPTAKDNAGRNLASLRDVVVDIKSRMDDRHAIRLGQRRWHASELAAEVMRAVREVGAKHLDSSLRRALVVVPAHASEPQRAATRAAAQSAGLLETKLIGETLAAAIAAHKARGDEGWYLVYHWGAGPFEASVIRVEGQRYEVASAVGDRKVRGDRLDRRIADLIDRQYRNRGWPRLLEDSRSRAILLRRAEKIKVHLSKTPHVKEIFRGPRAGSELIIDLRASEIEQWFRPDVEATIRLARQALAEAQLDVSDLEALLAVGGTTALPLVKQLCQDAFGQTPVPLDTYAVARGAAIQAQTVSEEEWAAVSAPAPMSPGE